MTKRGKGSHGFNNELLQRYYDEHEQCLLCKRAGADSFHHAIPRSRRFTDSILNATPLHNQSCNIMRHGEIHRPETTLAFLRANISRLHRAGYKLQPVDVDFIKEHPLAMQAAKEIL